MNTLHEDMNMHALPPRDFCVALGFFLPGAISLQLQRTSSYTVQTEIPHSPTPNPQCWGMAQLHPQLPAAASLGCGAGQPHSELCLPEACLRRAAPTASPSTMSVSPLPGGSEMYVTRWVLAPAPPIIQCLTLPRVSSFITLSFGCHRLAADTLFYQATKIHPKAKCFGGE